MKIFYKKDYLEQVKINERLKQSVETSKKVICDLEFIKKKYESVIDLQASDNYDLCEKIKRLQNAKGGYVKQNNKLKNQVMELEKEVEDLKAKLEESMSNKYLVKKVPSGRKPNTIKTKVSAPMSSTVRKYMKEAFDE